MFVAGVDGCNAGWVTFNIYDSGESAVEVVDVAEWLRSRPNGLQALGIDIPIGLRDGARRCDTAARRLLGQPRASSVFTPPCRAALQANGHADGCEINESYTRKRLSIQAWAIAPKIKAVDDAIMPEHQGWAFEVHPEVCFWHLAGGRAMSHSKRKRAGREERLAILSQHLPGVLTAVQNRPPRVAVDDVLDAAAAALTAQRWRRGLARPVCDPEVDGKGLRMEIVY
jgi:predicted RNase H-like nuclease